MKGGVPLAFLAIVAAVWIALRLSQGPPTELAMDARPPTATGNVEGFRAGARFLPDEELLGFVEIPAGPFVMGSDASVDPDAFDIERWSSTSAQGIVDLPAFYLARYEVTVAQMSAFLVATAGAIQAQALQTPPDHPAAFVSWPDALAYAGWIDATLRESSATPPQLRALLSDGWRITLPTEAEWEKAARGVDGRLYPWGSEPRQDRANYSSRSAVPVGSYECSECPFGLADMAGNVWEWTRSPDQPYPYDATDDGEGLEAEALWIMRGGSFRDGQSGVRAAMRGRADPGARRAFIGFRLALVR